MAPSKYAARRFLIGLATIAVLVALGYIAFTANQGRLPGTPMTTVRAAFDDIGQLQPGSEVRQNGATIGQVSSVALVDGKAIVTMSLTGGIPMYQDGYAGVWDESALAQKFVELRPGTPSSGLLGDAVLPVTQTESSHDLVQVLDIFDPSTRVALGSALRQLGGGLAGYGPGLHDFVSSAPAALSDISQVSATLASARTDLPRVLRTTDRLSSRFAGREYQPTELLQQAESTLRAIGVDDGRPLGDTLAKLPGSLKAARGALQQAEQPLTDLAAATRDLRTGAVALGKATTNARGVLREAPAPLGQLPGVIDHANPAVDDLTETLSDAQPFMPRLADGLSSAASPLKELAPYAKDIGTLANNFDTLVAAHDGWEHKLRIMFGAPTSISAGGNQIKDAANAYPVPGQATRDRDATGGLIPGN